MLLYGNYWLFWFAMGFGFLALEVLTPGIVFLFFGLGSWTVLLILLLFPLPPSVQWIIFVVVSVVFLITLRRQFKRILSKKEIGRSDSLREPMVANSYLGREIEVVSEITPEKPGLVELNGTNWQARSRVAIPKGAWVKVLEVQNLSLLVEPVGEKTQP
ncbi:MAG: NfeD family protein [Deltaproteobacteria bacterium]|jgi:membrane protein implicated in regulation of membrane protease activity|nr:NfeD family protein [Deltaproteobacteria bacterium]